MRIYESPDRGKTVYAREANDYAHRTRIAAWHHQPWHWSAPLWQAAQQFGSIEQNVEAPETKSTKAPT